MALAIPTAAARGAALANELKAHRVFKYRDGCAWPTRVPGENGSKGAFESMLDVLRSDAPTVGPLTSTGRRCCAERLSRRPPIARSRRSHFVAQKQITDLSVTSIDKTRLPAPKTRRAPHQVVLVLMGPWRECVRELDFTERPSRQPHRNLLRPRNREGNQTLCPSEIEAERAVLNAI
jgi:hypothetical protein